MAEYIYQADPIGEGQYHYTLIGELVRCGNCVYYDPPHIEDGTRRYEYKDMPSDAFDGLGTGLVHSGYGVNVGGRCLRSKLRLARGKSIFMDEDDYCSRGERRADE